MKFVADENFDNRIIRGVQRCLPEFDIVRIQDLTIAGANDPTVLEWADQVGRILLTHDQKTIPHYASERLKMGQTIADVIVVKDNLSIGLAIDNILLIIECSSASEWINQIQRLPL